MIPLSVVALAVSTTVTVVARLERNRGILEA